MSSRDSYRVTKYDPTCRDSDGSFLVNEWTSVDDIGDEFPKGVLKLYDYLITEASYVESVLLYWQSAQSPALTLSSLETKGLKTARQRLSSPQLHDVLTGATPTEGEVLEDSGAIARHVRLILRGIVWGKLESKSGFFAHFGWDYYMYLGGVEMDDSTRAAIEDTGLFVERFSSPYFG